MMPQCWTSEEGTKNNRGYVWFTIRGKTNSAHRLSYEAHYGQIPEGLTIDHLCLNKACYNPTHLEVVTNQINNQRRAQLITHCPQGHLYDEVNTYLSSKGKRTCKACHWIKNPEQLIKQRDSMRRMRARRRAGNK